ncbi:MAG: hypothetical protein K2O00_08285 [Muribaculaceae bacterium]|nr:hypothetical protein [Muribaculaceae bacterium]
MGKHFSDRLRCCSYPFGSDDDQPMVMEICVGINSNDELVVSVDFHDYNNPAYNCSTAAVVNGGDARRMARRHGVRFEELPRFVSDCMAQWRELVNPTFGQVVSCFKEITECLLDERCRFRVERSYGPCGFRCC